MSGIFKKMFPNPNLPPRFHQVQLWLYLKEGTRIEMPHTVYYESDSPAWLHINGTTETGKISRRLTTPLCLSFVSDSADSKRRYLYYSPLLLVLLCLPTHSGKL